VVTARLGGSNQLLIDRYEFNSNPVLLVNTATGNLINPDGSIITAPGNAVAYQANAIKTEKVNTFEIGYKGLISNRLLIDAYYYNSTYIDFISTVRFIQNTTPQANASDAFTSIATGGATQLYQFDVNSPDDVKAQGYAVGLEYSLAKGYNIGGNAAFNELKNQDELTEQGLQPQYNTPEWRYNIKFGNRKLTDKLGFNVTWRWQDAFLWQSSIGTGVIPAYQTLDAQVSYKLSSIKTILKVGGSNILNERYTTSFTNPSIGAVYYISLNFEEFLN
jgi:outer membrane receptor protein involved in Fe transport